MTNALERQGAPRTLFDSLRQHDEFGECWSARDLMAVYGYRAWREFSRIIDRAKLACATSAQDVSSNFASQHKINNSRHRIEDYRLTRYAAYLIAMEGDPSKPEIAGAKTYFAVQTRRAEVALDGLDDDLSAIQQSLAAIQQLRNVQREMHVRQLAHDVRLEDHETLIRTSRAEVEAAQRDADQARQEAAEGRRAAERATRELADLAGRVGNVEQLTPLKDRTRLHTIKEAAQLLGHGHLRFYEMLRDMGIVYRDGGGHKIYQRYLDADWGEAKWQPWNNGEGHTWVPYLTPKGIVEIRRRLNEAEGKLF